MRRPLVGVFVGGRSSRMGRPKGLLPAPDTGEPLYVRTARLARELGAEVTLVGASEDYAFDGERLADATGIVGPLAGIVSLLARGDGQVVSLACDMPFLTSPLLARLFDAPPARAVAPRVAGAPHPFFARWDAPAVLGEARAFATEGGRSPSRLLERVDALALALSDGEALLLRDWDTPGDLAP